LNGDVVNASAGVHISPCFKRSQYRPVFYITLTQIVFLGASLKSEEGIGYLFLCSNLTQKEHFQREKSPPAPHLLVKTELL